MAIVGIYQGHVYRLGRDGQYERLFADCDDARAVGAREIEFAAGSHAHRRSLRKRNRPQGSQRR